MKKLLQAIARNKADAAVILGGAVTSVGIGMIYVPAGVIAAGVLTILFAIAGARGGGDEE